ncbi:MAG: hypothetical protein Q9210_001154 [Variospora velana]
MIMIVTQFLGLDWRYDHLLSLSELLYATEDDFDSRIKAQDVMLRHKFAPSSGDNAWQYDGKTSGGQPSQPNWVPDGDTGRSELDELRSVNDLQDQLDSPFKTLQEVKWSLFAVQWDFVTDAHSNDSTRRDWYSTRASTLREQEQMIFGSSCQPQRLGSMLKLKGLCARKWQLTRRFVPPGQMESIHIPHALGLLGREALATQDHGSFLGFKSWKGQPWCPLYLAWEATYFHILIEKWYVDPLTSLVDSTMPRVRYVVKENLAIDPQSTDDRRSVSGRDIGFESFSGASLGHTRRQTAELAGLTRHLTTVFLRSFFQMINRAIETMPFSPPDYAAYATSISGKPFALVNVGFSLELAAAPLRSGVVTSPPSALGPAVPTKPAPLLSYDSPHQDR